MTAPRDLWIGTYPAQGGAAGSGEGVWRVEVGPDGTFGEPWLVAATPAPSFLALHPSGRTLYAAAEQGSGAVSAFPVLDDGSLGEPVTRSSGGDSPCHLLALDDVLWVANYMDGATTYVELDPADGSFATAGGTDQADPGTGPVTDRQEGPHAHFALRVPAPDGVHEDVLVVDLGTDAVHRFPVHPWDLTRAGSASSPYAALLPAGTGPRHAVLLPGGALVVAGELDARLHVLTAATGYADPRAVDAAPDDPVRGRVVVDGWAPASSVPATAGVPDTARRPAQPSHVTYTPTPHGGLLLTGVRGSDVLAVHRVHDADTAEPTLEPLADVDLGDGAWPRHHEVLGTAADGRLLVVVARQEGGDLTSVLVDPATGDGEVVGTVGLPTPPACVLEAR